jgi:predicted nucleic acid-binding protein
VDELSYVDSSAFVKLIVREPESEAMLAAVGDKSLASSALLEVEAVRAVRRRQPDDEPTVREWLAEFDLVEISAEIRESASTLADPHTRSLDAIHLATALSLGDHLGAFFVYDRKLIAAAQAHGLPVSVPQP